MPYSASKNGRAPSRVENLLAAIVGAFLLLVGSASVVAEEPTLVAAASSLRTLWPELAAAYSQETKQPEPRVSFASSGLLSTQIRNGAPFHIFLSADEAIIAKLQAEGKIRGKAHALAQGELRLATVENSTTSKLLSSNGLNVLNDAIMDPGFRLAMPNPQHAPYGIAARQALSTLKLWPLPAGKLLAAENAAQTVQFLRTGAVSAAIVPWSLVIIKNENLVISRLPDNSYTPVQHIAARINHDSSGADAFISWLSSNTANQLLQRHGLGAMPQAAEIREPASEQQ